ncbi:MAG: hypothetical protein D6725_09570 [Planctomycetota bacterium]|nr:MAG: hypothetical protein D6725_09570 [Planctomycetota bacterium]
MLAYEPRHCSMTTERRISRRVWVLYAGYLCALAAMAMVAFERWLIAPPAGSRVAADVVWQHYYPELWSSGLLSEPPAPSDGRFDVLLLGGSVLEQLEPFLRDEFAQATGARARIFGLARAAHTSRDSYNKVRRLAGTPVDLVIVYHGINDVRMNCCPPGTFREDYAHCAWYDSFERRLRRGKLTLTEALQDRVESIALGAPERELLDEGRVLKTPAAFRKNVEAIIRRLREGPRAPEILLATFALALPEGYTRDAFEQRRLGYGDGSYKRCPAELWGHPDAVRAGVAAHNRVIRTLALERTTLFCDLAATLDARTELFVDPCHLTEEGCRIAAGRLARAARPAIQRWLERNSLARTQRTDQAASRGTALPRKSKPIRRTSTGRARDASTGRWHPDRPESGT